MCAPSEADLTKMTREMKIDASNLNNLVFGMFTNRAVQIFGMYVDILPKNSHMICTLRFTMLPYVNQDWIIFNLSRK